MGSEQSLNGSATRPRKLADQGYIDLIGDSEHELIVLTHRGEGLAGGVQ